MVCGFENNLDACIFCHGLSIYEGRLFVCFVCHIEFSQNLNAFCHTLNIVESLQWGGVHHKGFGFIMFQLAVKKLLNIEQFFIEFLCNWKLKGNLGVPLVLMESPQWVAFNEGDLEFFRPKVQEILNFEYFVIENSIKL